LNSPKEQNTAAQLFKELKQKQIAPVYLFFGEEDFLIEQFTDAVHEAALQPGDKDFNLDIFWANEYDGAAIVNAAAAFPMMAERRLIIVKEIHLLDDKSQALLLKYAQKPSPTSCVILTSSKITAAVKKLRPLAFSIEAKPLYENQAPQWIKSHVKTRGFTISDEAIGLLQLNVGVSLRRLASEIDKIELLLKGRSEISIADVEAIVGSAKEFTIFELGDAVADKKLDKSLRVLERLLELGESAVGILAMLSRHFILLAKSKEIAGRRAQREEIAKLLKINAFFVEKYLQQSTKYKHEHLAQIFILLLRADQHLKSSYQKPRLVLETLIVEIYSLT
jgi:DNA polymerase III subunit delta